MHVSANVTSQPPAIAPFAWSPAAGQQKMTLRNGEQNPAGLICGIPASALSIASANPPPSGISVRLCASSFRHQWRSFSSRTAADGLRPGGAGLNNPRLRAVLAVPSLIAPSFRTARIRRPWLSRAIAGVLPAPPGRHSALSAADSAWSHRCGNKSAFIR